MAEERTREELLHKIGELEDIIEVQENTIGSLSDKHENLKRAFSALQEEANGKATYIDELLDCIAHMRELNEKMYVLYTEASWKIRQYEESEKRERYQPFKEGEE